MTLLSDLGERQRQITTGNLSKTIEISRRSACEKK
jgi:hypothetical protein